MPELPEVETTVNSLNILKIKKSSILTYIQKTQVSSTY